MKVICALAVWHAKKNKQIGYLKYALSMIKIHYISHNLDTSVSFEDQSDQGVTQLVIKPFGTPKTSRIVSLS